MLKIFIGITNKMFSVIIPTFNNLEYLKLCLNSLKKNSNFDHEILVFINDGSDGTLDFVKEKKISQELNKIYKMPFPKNTISFLKENNELRQFLDFLS